MSGILPFTTRKVYHLSTRLHLSTFRHFVDTPMRTPDLGSVSKALGVGLLGARRRSGEETEDWRTWFERPKRF